MKHIRTILRIVLVLVFMTAAYFLAAHFMDLFFPTAETTVYYAAIIVAVVVVGVIIFICSSFFVRGLEKFSGKVVSNMAKRSSRELLGGCAGLILGLMIANLIGNPLRELSWGPYITMALALFLGYVGFWVGIGKNDEISHYFNKPKQQKERINRKEARLVPPAILDTSVIIDGRIADIYRTGFIESQLILPNFVLDELKRVADSPDPLKKSRGRRGMDILNELQKDFPEAFIHTDKDYEDIKEVDIKIIRLAIDMKARIYTNDFNLNKMAQVQNVTVLNINDLANAVKVVVLPGEELIVRIIKEGREADQGIAYLDDGTMIFVEGGKDYSGVTLTVVVTSVLQTTAGRMIFAKPK